jgi:hypothetical protein
VYERRCWSSISSGVGGRRCQFFAHKILLSAAGCPFPGNARRKRKCPNVLQMGGCAMILVAFRIGLSELPFTS